MWVDASRFVDRFRHTTRELQPEVLLIKCLIAIKSIEILALIVQPVIVGKQLSLQGFVRRQFKERWMVAIKQNLQWVQENKLKHRETITHGFENTLKALVGVMKGENVGKAVVRVKGSQIETESLDFNSALSKFKKFQGQ